MAKTPPAPTLTCKECGYVNEPERVYCHNCGQKLDRSVLPKEAEIRRETPEQAQRRIRKMTNPKANPVLVEAKAFVKTITWAVVVAALIQMAREPDGVPQQNNELPSRLISSELMDLTETPQPRALSFSEGDLNYLFKQQVKNHDTLVPGVQFERAFVNLHPSTAVVTVQQSILGFPLYSSVSAQPLYTDGKFTPKVVGSAIGRLPVHPSLFPYTSYLSPFRPLGVAMKREEGYLAKLREVRVDEGKATLISKGTGPVGTPKPAAAPAAPVPAPAAAAPATPAATPVSPPAATAPAAPAQ